jgi:hypothetical protein
MTIRSRVVLLLFIFSTAPSSIAAELDQQALASWDDHLTAVKLQVQERLNGSKPFLWVDEDPNRKQRINAGEIVISPLCKSCPISIPHGLIYHWVGGVFIPGATIEDLGAVLNDYGRYSEIYRPTLIKAELLHSVGNEQKFSVLWIQRVLLLTAAFYTELDSNYVALNGRQGYMNINATRIQQIEHYGEIDERRLTPDEGSGYVWRLVTFARFEERDGGLYLELEVVALSRDLSAAARFLLEPLNQSTT